eukprot:3941952-Rhodomonas_salina.1
MPVQRPRHSLGRPLGSIPLSAYALAMRCPVLKLAMLLRGRGPSPYAPRSADLPAYALATPCPRVAASIVVFSGLPELVARDLEAYEADIRFGLQTDYLSIAAQVAKDSGRLKKLRRQVREQRQGWRLTDPAGWARDFR